MQSGISLYLAIIVMVILLAIVLGLTTILVDQMKMVREMGYSVIALSAADAGIEKVLMSRSSPTDDGCIDEATACLLGDAKYYLDIRDNSASDCLPPLSFCITSVGIYEGVRRAIEITY